MALKEMIGKKFGVLEVLSREQNSKDGSARWKCVCECGEFRVIDGTALRAGRNKSCGCLSPRFTTEKTKTHGLSGKRIYRIWIGMIARCSENSKGKTRKLYYEKGIRVCDRWLSFVNFYEDMGDPLPNQSIDRIDGSKGYEPSNCRWATSEVQANNTTANHVVSHDGRSMTIAMWAKEIGVKQNTLLYRIRRGASIEDALCKKQVLKRSIVKQSRTKKCLVCCKEFIPRLAQLKVGHGKYCSQKCNGESRKIERLLEMRENS